MNHGELQTRLGTLLKVKTKRYPLEIRTEHLNQAISDLDDEFESWFSEDSTSWPTVASTGEYDIATQFASPALKFVAPVDVYYLDGDGNEVHLDQLTIEEMTIKYPHGSDEGEPQHFAIYEQKIHVRPTPDAAYTLYWKFMGKKRPLSDAGDSNEWTEKEPYAVLYTAAIYGCIHILEENRAASFVKMADKKISSISIRQSRRMSARRPVSQEPGATLGV